MIQLADGVRAAEVLLVDDNDADVELTREGFRRAKLALNMQRVADGEECMAYLRREPPFEDAPTPDLILLDLNMPRMGGREVLAELVADEELRGLPVVILSTAAEHDEVMGLYKMRVSSHIHKPVDFQQFVRAIAELGVYWFTLVDLPDRSAV